MVLVKKVEECTSTSTISSNSSNQIICYEKKRYYRLFSFQAETKLNNYGILIEGVVVLFSRILAVLVSLFIKDFALISEQQLVTRPAPEYNFRRNRCR